MEDNRSIISTVDNAHKSNQISVKPYFDPNRSNLGLEKYNMVLFDKVFHEEQLAAIERNGVVRYLTGLNEFAPEVKLIEDPEVKAATIKKIRETVSQLEKELASNVVKPDDEEFWDKIKLLHPSNREFWDKITIRCGNETLFLDPKKDPYDLIKIHAIEAGGFNMIAPSYEAAREMAVPPTFYLDKAIDTIAIKTSAAKLRNKALAKLQTLFDEDQTKLFYVAKDVDANSAQYKKNTPNDLIYDNMDKYITGQGVEKNLKRAAQTFLDTAKLDMETLKIRAIVKDASFYKFIIVRSDGLIYHSDSQSKMGRNVAECVDFLKDPLNEDVLTSLMQKVENTWNQ